METIYKSCSRWDVKSIQESPDAFIVSGTASTPSPDRVGDVVVPTGCKFALPLPLLWQHAPDAVVGSVIAAKATPAGIQMTASLPKVKEPGTLQDRINEAVQSIRYKLVTGLSVGFRALNNAIEFLENGGVQFNEWEWLELSLVSVPANAACTIQIIKTIDAKLRSKARLPVPIYSLRTGKVIYR